MKKIIAIIVLVSVCSVAAESLKGFKFISPKLTTIFRGSGAPGGRCSSSRGASHPCAPQRASFSTNWGGYAAAPNFTNPVNGSVSKVHGTWVVPHLSPSNRNTYCAVWVGIDGYTSDTVEQIGTEHDWINGGQQNYAWFEMFPRAAYAIDNFPVRPGDSISAAVLYLGSNQFLLKIANITRKIFTSAPMNLTRMAAKRNCAEWIVEPPFLNRTLPLAHFGKIFFRACTAKMRGVEGSISNNHWKHTKIVMITPSNAVKAQPSGLSNGGLRFNVTWKHE